MRGAVLVLLVLLTACATQRHLAAEDIRPIPYVTGPAVPSGTHIDGLRDALNRPPYQPVTMLAVHGMITPNRGYSDLLQRALGAELDLRPVGTRTIDLVRGYQAGFLAGLLPIGTVSAEGSLAFLSQLTRSEWRRPENQAIGLTVYELFWAPLRDDAKYRFLGCFESRSVARDEAAAHVRWDCEQATAAQPNRGPRSLINGYVKDSLMVRGFADAMIVTSPIAELLRDDLSLAFCVIAADRLAAGGRYPQLNASVYEGRRCDLERALGADLPGALAALHEEETVQKRFYGVTESLGSYFFLEAQLLRGFGEGIQQFAFVLSDNATVYMFANQVSLLGLTALTVSCKVEPCANPRVHAIEQSLDKPRPGHAGLYVAFNDPDDVLGFELPPYMGTPENGLLVNITVRNPALGVPFLIRSPLDVHGNHDRNPAVIEAMVAGFTIPEPRQ